MLYRRQTGQRPLRQAEAGHGHTVKQQTRRKAVWTRKSARSPGPSTGPFLFNPPSHRRATETGVAIRPRDVAGKRCRHVNRLLTKRRNKAGLANRTNAPIVPPLRRPDCSLRHAPVGFFCRHNHTIGRQSHPPPACSDDQTPISAKKPQLVNVRRPNELNWYT